MSQSIVSAQVPGPEVLVRNLMDHATSDVPRPQVLRSASGTPLCGYDAENLAFAVLHSVAAAQAGRFEDALSLVRQMQLTVEIEGAALRFLRLAFAPPLLDRFAPESAHEPGEDRIKACLWAMYAEFTGRSVAELQADRPQWDERLRQLWRQCVPDEDHVTAEQLTAYHDALSMPEADGMLEMIRSRYGLACRAVPVSLARQLDCQAAFDYGGGAGWSAAALGHAGVPTVTLIEKSPQQLEFARWRNAAARTPAVQCLSEDELIVEIDKFTGLYEFGMCTEVLEHVLDVESTVERLARMLKPGGYLFMSASFGKYPHASHLKANVHRSGRENELMAEHGFQSIELDSTFPLPIQGGLYRRQA